MLVKQNDSIVFVCRYVNIFIFLTLLFSVQGPRYMLFAFDLMACNNSVVVATNFIFIVWSIKIFMKKMNNVFKESPKSV